MTYQKNQCQKMRKSKRITSFGRAENAALRTRTSISVHVIASPLIRRVHSKVSHISFSTSLQVGFCLQRVMFTSCSHPPPHLEIRAILLQAENMNRNRWLSKCTAKMDGREPHARLPQKHHPSPHPDAPGKRRPRASDRVVSGPALRCAEHGRNCRHSLERAVVVVCYRVCPYLHRQP